MGIGEDDFLLNMFGNTPKRIYSYDDEGNLLEDNNLLMTPMSSNGGIPSLPSNFLNSTPTFSPRRTDDLNRISSEISTLQDQKANALSELTKEGNLSSDNALAVALTAIVPTLLGLGFGGGLKGAAIGSQAGLAGANVGLTGLNADIAKRDANNKLLYQDAVERLKSKENEAENIRTKIADAEELGQRTAYNADAMTGRANAKQRPPVPDTVINEIAKRTGQSPDTVRAFAQTDPYQMQTMMYGLGANTKLLGDAPLQQISAGRSGLQNLQSLRPILQEMSSDNSLQRALESGNVTGYYKDPASAGYRFYAQLPTLQKQVASIMESGKLTDKDVEFLSPFITGSILYDTPETIGKRLDVLQGFIERGINNIVDVQGSAGRNVTGFKVPTTEGVNNSSGNIGDSSIIEGGKKLTLKKIIPKGQ